jgi:Putative Ig domain
MAAVLSIALVASQAAFARVSSKATLESQIMALAKSHAGRSAAAKLGAELTSPAVAGFPSVILHEYVSVLTPFERELVAAGALVASPGAQRLIAAVKSQRRLRPAQARALARLMIAVADNRAVKLLEAKGWALKLDPAALAADLSTLTGPLAPVQATGGGSPGAAAALNALEATRRSHAVVAFSAEMTKLLSNPGAVGLVQRLGPLDLASLIPIQELSSLSLPIAENAAFSPAPIAHSAGLESLSPQTVGLITLGLGAAKLGIDQLVDVIGNKLLTDPYLVGDLPQELSLAWDIAIRNTVGYAVVDGALAFSAGFQLVAWPVVGVLAGAGAVAWADKLTGQLWPTTLSVSPAEETIPLGSVRTYTVDAIDAAGDDVGAVSASLTIAPPGTPCVDDACGASNPGHYLVIARDGTAEGTAKLTVEAKLEITPMSFPVTIKPVTLANGVETEAYSQTLTAEGGKAPYTWAVTAGALPKGLGLDPSTGVISGTPTSAGTSHFEIAVTDKNGTKGTAQYSLTVKQGSHQCASVCAFPAPDELENARDGVTLIWHESASFAADRYVAEVQRPDCRAEDENLEHCNYSIELSEPPLTSEGVVIEGRELQIGCNKDGEVAECTLLDEALGERGEVIYFAVYVLEPFVGELPPILIGTSNAVTIE